MKYKKTERNFKRYDRTGQVIIDNKQHCRVSHVLKNRWAPDARLTLRTNKFTLSAYYEDRLFSNIAQENLDISGLSYENLYKLYADIISRITALQSACTTDRFSIADDTEHQRELLSATEKLQSQVDELRSRLKKESQFNEKVQLNMELKKLEQLVAEKQQALKEI